VTSKRSEACACSPEGTRRPPAASRLAPVGRWRRRTAANHSACATFVAPGGRSRNGSGTPRRHPMPAEHRDPGCRTKQAARQAQWGPRGRTKQGWLYADRLELARPAESGNVHANFCRRRTVGARFLGENNDARILRTSQGIRSRQEQHATAHFSRFAGNANCSRETHAHPSCPPPPPTPNEPYPLSVHTNVHLTCREW